MSNNNIFQKLEKLPLDKIYDLLEMYDAESAEYKENLRIKGKTHGEANRENASWLAYYDERRVELQSVKNYLEMEIAKIRGKLFKAYTEGHMSNVALGERAKDKYIDQEPEYLKRKRAFLEVEELLEKYKSIIRAFEQRGYDLRNLTQLKVAAVDNIEI